MRVRLREIAKLPRTMPSPQPRDETEGHKQHPPVPYCRLDLDVRWQLPCPLVIDASLCKVVCKPNNDMTIRHKLKRLAHMWRQLAATLCDVFEHLHSKS